MKRILIILFSIICIGCKPAKNTQFTEKALDALLINLNGKEAKFKDILEQHKGKTILIDVWAGWCGDCIKNLPSLKKIQKKYTNTQYLFISLDKNQNAWKKNINRFHIKGEHYYANHGWKSIFASNIDLDWIPRYIVVNPNGEVILYRAIDTNDSDLIQSLETFK